MTPPPPVLIESFLSLRAVKCGMRRILFAIKVSQGNTKMHFDTLREPCPSGLFSYGPVWSITFAKNLPNSVALGGAIFSVVTATDHKPVT